MLSKKIDAAALVASAEKKLTDAFAKVDAIAFQNQKRLLEAFRLHRVTEEYFAEKTGYGLEDAGRETIDKVYATAFGAEAAAVRMQFVSGTHAIACALFGNLSAGDTLFSLSGAPYDTLKSVIGLAGDEPGNLIESGVRYLQTDLPSESDLADGLAKAIKDNLPAGKCLFYIQKSRGYSSERRTLSCEEIGKMVAVCRSLAPAAHVFVDNCYGEFVEAVEPIHVGADLMAGSLIKNPGGGLAISGGYVAGKKSLVDRALNRLTAPGIGGHLGITFNQNRLILQGFFLAPSVVSNAVKGALLTAQVLSELDCKVMPGPEKTRYDIIQAVQFGAESKLINFCRAVQHGSPVNSHVVPESLVMPGYQDAVIMAGGTFVEGSTIELSADGPIRPPFTAFVQGGLTYLHVKCMLEDAVSLSASGELPFF